MEEGGEAAQPKAIRWCNFLFTEPSPSEHLLQHISLSSAARQQFRYLFTEIHQPSFAEHSAHVNPSGFRLHNLHIE